MSEADYHLAFWMLCGFVVVVTLWLAYHIDRLRMERQ